MEGAQQLQNLHVVILDIVMESLKIVTVVGGHPFVSEVYALARLASVVFGPKLKCGDLSQLNEKRPVRGKIKELHTQASPPGSNEAPKIRFAACFEEKFVPFGVGNNLAGKLDVSCPVALN